jgi:hypothetical protein
LVEGFEAVNRQRLAAKGRALVDDGLLRVLDLIGEIERLLLLELDAKSPDLYEVLQADPDGLILDLETVDLASVGAPLVAQEDVRLFSLLLKKKRGVAAGYARVEERDGVSRVAAYRDLPLKRHSCGLELPPLIKRE